MKTEKSDQTDFGENQIVVYQPDEISRIDVRFERNTVWLTQRQMAELFGCSSDNVGLHLRNIYNEGELVESATAEDSSVVRLEGKRKVVRRVRFYNLDAIISVGFRVNSRRGIQFRQWANGVIQDHLLKGYGGLSVRVSKNFHDRFLIIDDKTLYLVGASLKDLGSKCFAFAKLDASSIPLLKARV